HLLGGSLSIWTEYIPRMSTLEKRVFPRILAGAEAMWSPYDKEHYLEFENRAQVYEDTYNAFRNFTSVEYANRTKGFMPLMDKLWWARRPLHWEGLHNLIDDASVKSLAKKQAKNK
ncbi:MAG: family 20 glycosylhydrolase, partial [Clostridia bacterium]